MSNDWRNEEKKKKAKFAFRFYKQLYHRHAYSFYVLIFQALNAEINTNALPFCSCRTIPLWKEDSEFFKTLAKWVYTFHIKKFLFVKKITRNWS